MNTRVFRHLLIVIIFSAIPSLLSYLASSSLIFDQLIEWQILNTEIDIPHVQDCCLWLGIFLSAVFLSGQLFMVKIQLDGALGERNGLIKMNKNILSKALGGLFDINQLDFNIRIFVPKFPRIYAFYDMMARKKHKKKEYKDFWKKRKKTFIIKNIDLIADQGTTKDLEFEVSPQKNGLVGVCYNKKAVVYDDNLEKTNNTNYNLTKRQVNRTSDLKWIICCPIIDNNDNVVAIVAFDGKTPIKINASATELASHISAFSNMLYDSIPQLFKR